MSVDFPPMFGPVSSNMGALDSPRTMLLGTNAAAEASLMPVGCRSAVAEKKGASTGAEAPGGVNVTVGRHIGPPSRLSRAALARDMCTSSCAHAAHALSQSSRLLAKRRTRAARIVPCDAQLLR